MKTKTPTKIRDYFLTKEVFSISKIKNLDVFQTLPKTDKENIKKYYKSKNYLSHNNNKTFFSFLYLGVKRLNFYFKYRVLKKASSHKNRLLDFGSGNAYFVSKLNQNGGQAYAYDPFYNQVSNKTVEQQKVLVNESDLIASKFKTVTMWHSLEHVFSYKNTLSIVFDILDYKGCLIVACPNYKSFDAVYYKKFWAGYDVPRHYWHFSPKGLIDVMSDSGFEYISKKPMHFDAFYVSMLSEQYKKSKLWFIKGFLIGLASNLVSLFKGNASSYVYVFKKRF